MIALIDMDLVCYRCAASAEQDDVGIAIYRMNELLDQILAKTEATAYRAFLTGKKNFRKEIYPEYKANRKQPKPRHLAECREYACEQMSAEITEHNLEADDYLGIYQTDDTIICSLDKDLLQVAGKHFRWEISGAGWTKPDTFLEQTELEGLRLFYEQCLKGDTSDNVKGVAKIGEAKAKKLLADCTTEKEMLDVVLSKYDHEEEFMLNAQCLWILRSFDEYYPSRFERIMNENSS